MSLVQLYDNYLNRKREEIKKKNQVLMEISRFECGHMKDVIMKTFDNHLKSDSYVTIGNYDNEKVKNVSRFSGSEQSKLCKVEFDELKKCFSGLDGVEFINTENADGVNVKIVSLGDDNGKIKTYINVNKAW